VRSQATHGHAVFPTQSLNDRLNLLRCWSDVPKRLGDLCSTRIASPFFLGLIGAKRFASCLCDREPAVSACVRVCPVRQLVMEKNLPRTENTKLLPKL
jgi:hypothetical protein